MGKRYRAGDQALVSQMAVVNRVRRAVEAGNASRVSQLVKGHLERISIPIIVEAAEEGDRNDYLLPAVEKTLDGRSLAWPRHMARVMASSYGPDACVMGGVALVLHDILSRPALVT